MSFLFVKIVGVTQHLLPHVERNDTIADVKDRCYVTPVRKGGIMMMGKRFLALGLTVAMTGSLLVGCGSAGTESSAGASAGSSESGHSGNENAKVELELFSTKTENADILQQMIDGFMEKNPDIKITLTSESDAATVLKTRLTKNDVPELIAMGGDSNYTELQSAGVLLDLSGEDFISEVQSAYLEMLYDVNVDKEQKAYGVPYATNASGVLYNEDLFAQAGVEVPQTWSEFQDVVIKLQEAGITPFELTFADSWTCLPPWNSMAPVIPAENFTDERKEGKTAFTGTHEEVLEKYLWLLDYAQDDFMGTTYTDGNAAFANGAAAMMINGNWAISEFLNTNPDMNVNMFAFPSVDEADRNTVTSGVDVLLAVSNQGDEAQQEAAKEFIRYALTPEVAQSYIDDQFAFSAVNGVEQKNETVSGVSKDIANGKVSNFPDHYYPNGFDLSAILQQFALNKVDGMDDTENITETLQSCDEQYDAANVE